MNIAALRAATVLKRSRVSAPNQKLNAPNARESWFARWPPRLCALLAQAGMWMTTPGKVERNRGMQQRRPEEMGRLRRMGRPNRSRTRALARPRVSRRRQQRLRWLLPLRLRRL